jgi:hypothetical protein
MDTNAVVSQFATFILRNLNKHQKQLRNAIAQRFFFELKPLWRKGFRRSSSFCLDLGVVMSLTWH